jgi:hypothetical protein
MHQGSSWLHKLLTDDLFSEIHLKMDSIYKKQELLNDNFTNKQTLDISYSSKVSDIGLVYLCGISPSTWGGFDQFNPSSGTKDLTLKL